jgi:diguanylate cyclase (GGDEF)-like protein
VGESSPSLAEQSRIYRVIHYVTYVGISAHAAFIALFFWLQVPLLGWFNVGSVVAWCAARWLNQRGRLRTAAMIITVEVLAHAVLACSLLGWNSGFHYYLVPLMPFVIFNDRLSTRQVVAASAALSLVYLALRYFTGAVTPPPRFFEAIQYMNLAVPLTALAIISVYFRAGSIEAERRMEELAMTDALTQLPNRRRMREMLELEQVRFSRGGRPFAVIIGDIDGFKQINDNAGHDCGDYVLRELATILRGVLRAQDGLARWGGEEFLFLLPETDHPGAGVVAEKLRAAVENAGLKFAERAVRVTMTFGVSVYTAGAGSAEACVRRADQALYAGKDQGKNRVVLLAASA